MQTTKKEQRVHTNYSIISMMELNVMTEVFPEREVLQEQQKRCRNMINFERQRDTTESVTRRLSSLLSEDLISFEFTELNLSAETTTTCTSNSSSKSISKTKDIECLAPETIDDPFQPIDVSQGTKNFHDDAERIVQLLDRRRIDIVDFLQAIPLPQSESANTDDDAMEDVSSESSSYNDDQHNEEEEDLEDGMDVDEYEERNFLCPLPEVSHNTDRSDVYILSSNDQPVQEKTMEKTMTTGARISDSSGASGASNDDGDEIIMLERPGPYDVICGRNSAAFNSVGNRRFRWTITMNLERYTKARRRDEKTKIIQEISNVLLGPGDEDSGSGIGSCGGGAGARFLKKLGKNRYRPLTLKQIHEKIGHCFREVQAAQQKSQDSQQRFDPFE